MSAPEPDPNQLSLPALDAASIDPERAAPLEPDAETARLEDAEDTPPEPSRRRTRAGSAGTSSRAPRKPARKPSSAPNTNQRAAGRRQFVERGVANTLGALAFSVTLIDAYDGQVIAQGSDDLVGAIMSTADANPSFMAWLERAIKGGSYLQLVAAIGAIAVPILAHHRLLPPALAFVMPAERAPDYAPDAPVATSPDGSLAE